MLPRGTLQAVGRPVRQQRRACAEEQGVADICSFTDSAGDGAIYRAIRSEGETACTIVLNAADAEVALESNPRNQVLRDLYDWWIESLARIRGLRAMFRASR